MQTTEKEKQIYSEALLKEADQDIRHPRHAFDMTIPGEIRIIPGLSKQEKYFYALIRNLCRREGYCWATSEYLALEAEVTIKTVQRWIAKLCGFGLIEREIIQHKMNKRRRIWMAGAHKFKNSIVRTSVSLPYGHQCPNDMDTNVPYTEERYTKERYIHKNTSNEVLAVEGKDPPSPAPASPISFNFKTAKFENISDRLISEWKELYPSADFDRELRKMVEWCMSNPSKAKSKKQWRKFISTWLNSTNEKAINFEARRASSSSTPKVDRRQKEYIPPEKDPW